MKKEKKEKYDKAYLRIAKEWGNLSYCQRKKVGAIIVKNKMIISDGYNGTPSGFENCCKDRIWWKRSTGGAKRLMGMS
jgi:dCMP deaminase